MTDDDPRTVADATSPLKLVHRYYEQGYKDGESSIAADWNLALDGILPDDIEPTPTQVAAYIEQLQQGGTDD